MESPRELLIPYGLDSGNRLVHAAQADRKRSYRCPACLSNLILKAGEIVTHHFAHKAETNCNGETIAHQAAKRLVAQTITEHSKGTASISLECECDRCRLPFHLGIRDDRFDNALVEHRVGEFVCDVVALKNGKAALAIEVLVTHEVSPDKEKRLEIPWIEIDAHQVLADPLKWIPKNSRLNPVVCPGCKTFLKKLKRLSLNWSIPLEEKSGYLDPKRATYLAAVAKCFQCKEDILLFWWDGVPFCNTPPPEPRPRTIQYRFSKAFGGKYWANTCPNCDSIQGDNFVFLGFREKPVFRDLPLRDSRPLREARARSMNDMVRIMTRHLG